MDMADGGEQDAMISRSRSVSDWMASRVCHALRCARTARTCRVSSSDGGRPSLAKVFLMCLLIASSA